MIRPEELNPHGYTTTREIDHNLQTLYKAINVVRTAYGKPMVVTSGLRSDADQARINPSAPKSKHLIGAACDIADKDGKLQEWVKANLPTIASAGLWIEAFSATPGWVHFQCLPPKSGNRIFLP